METKGYKTSEFWLTAASSIFSLLNQSGVIGVPLPTDLIMTVIGGVAAYVLGRSGVKAVAIKAEAQKQ